MPMLNGRKFPPLIIASSITPKEINWLWWPYIPAGSASMLFGPGGTGKSHIAVDIAARVSRGDKLPGQKEALAAQKVLILSAEDEFDRVLVPRLMAADANLENIAFPKAPFTLDQDGLAMIEQYMSAFGATIVFIDPLVAYIGGKIDLNRANETRVFTGGLHQLAMRTGTAVIVVHHSRKGTEGADYEKMMGSADFNNAVRSVLYTAQAPNGDRIMRHVKANYAALGPTLGYEFGDKGFEWTGVYKEDGVKEKRVNKMEQVHDWIRGMLKNGPKRAVDMERLGMEHGFNHNAMIRGKVGLAESYLVSKDGKMNWYWRLLEQTDGQIASDVPVMGDKWSAPVKDRVEREIIAREEERARGDGPTVVNGRRVLPDQTPDVGNDAYLAQWMKDNL